VPQLFKHTVFQVVICEMVSSKCILQGAIKLEEGGCSIEIIVRMWESSPMHCYGCLSCVLFGWALQIHCFTFLNVRTYRSELTVVHHCSNSINKIPFLSQKMLLMTLSSETCTLICGHLWVKLQMHFL
jgi:hypothetical protein